MAVICQKEDEPWSLKLAVWSLTTQSHIFCTAPLSCSGCRMERAFWRKYFSCLQDACSVYIRVVLYFAWQAVAGYGTDWFPSFCSGRLKWPQIECGLCNWKYQTLSGKTSLPFKHYFFLIFLCSYFQVIYKYPKNHWHSQNHDNLFCFTYITCKMCSSLCMKNIWSVYNWGELRHSLFMPTLIFHLKRKTHISILQTTKVYFLSEGFWRKWEIAVVTLSILHSPTIHVPKAQFL